MIQFAHATDNQTSQSVSPTKSVSPAKSTSLLMSFGPIILIIIVFWFLIMRPQQKKFKLHQQMLSKLKKGDKIITNSGIIGKIIKVHTDYFDIEISPGVDVQFEKNAILTLYNTTINNNTSANTKNNTSTNPKANNKTNNKT